MTQSATTTTGTGGFLRPEAVVSHLAVQKGWKVADLGCGSGYFTILLGQLVGPEGHVWAVDVLSQALEAVRSRARMMGIGNIEYVRANVEAVGTTKIPEGAMDLVLVANVLFQSKKKSDIIKEAARLVRPKGHMALIDWLPEAQVGHPEKGWHLSAKEAEKLVSESGLPLKLVKEFEAGQYHWGLLYERH